MLAAKLILAATATVLGGLAVCNAALAGDAETTTLNDNAFHASAHAVCDSSSGICTVVFPATTHTTTLVKAVSCFTIVTLGSVLTMALGSTGSNDSFTIPGSVSEVFPNYLGVSINASTYLFLEKGDSPVVNAYVTNGGSFTFSNSLNCTIAGEHS